MLLLFLTIVPLIIAYHYDHVIIIKKQKYTFINIQLKNDKIFQENQYLLEVDTLD